MTFRFPTQEWVEQLAEQLNASPTYERSAADWEGDFVFVIEPDAHFAQTAYLFLGLYHGKCTGGQTLATPGERAAEFTVTAPYSNWRQVVEGKLDPIQGMMTKKLKLQGNLMKVMRYPKAAKEIISCCAQVPTSFDPE